jgi:putative ABC transport system permease protein
MTRTRSALWLRWSWRDLRRHWLLVTALALVIALGTGAYAGLGGTTAWRLASNDASYAALQMHDLRVRLPDGGFVRPGALETVARGIPDAAAVLETEERLVVPTQVDASHGGRTILVPGEVVGMPAASSVDSLHRVSGQDLSGTDAVLESKFAGDYRLPAQGEVVLSGGKRVRYGGTGYSPEYFRIVGRSGSLLGETGFAVLFMPLTAAQTATGHAGSVNDLVLRLRPGSDRGQVQAQLAAAVSGLGATVITRDDDVVYKGLYADAHNDAKTWNMFALLILMGAAFAAFNLITRMIDAQRRELGVGMALGVSPAHLALRPLLVGLQIAVLGMVAGVGVGWLLGVAMRGELATLLPLPVWLTPFQTSRFVQAAALGVAIPFVATLLPLRRVLRLQPVDAIRTGAYGAAGGAGHLSALVRKVRVPGRSYVSMPLRNVLRAPRRTGLTALGIAAAITCLIAVLGLLDTFTQTGNRSEDELQRQHPDRLTVTLTGVVPSNSTVVRSVTAGAGVAAVTEQLRLGTVLSANGRRLDAVTEVMDLSSDLWAPTVTGPTSVRPEDGIVLSEKAAADLRVRPGDTISVQHPIRTTTGFRLATSRLEVSGLHPNPIRLFSYVDTRVAASLGLAGATNQLTVVPAPGTSQEQLLRTLFDRPAVASVEKTTGFSELLDYRLGQFTGILRVIEVASLLLALLIAFNTANLSADERARERATMMAFGLPARAVAGMAVAENAVIGIVGTAVGLVGGYLALGWIVAGFGSVMPDLSVQATLFPSTVLTTLLLGVLVVALAPLLGVRQQSRMDIPSTLRIVE